MSAAKHPGLVGYLVIGAMMVGITVYGIFRLIGLLVAVPILIVVHAICWVTTFMLWVLVFLARLFEFDIKGALETSVHIDVDPHLRSTQP